MKFTSVYPGWYEGGITHIHAQVYVNSKLKTTTQIAFPDDINTAVYKTVLYAAPGQNPGIAKNSADMIFSDSLSAELATVTVNTGGHQLQYRRLSGPVYPDIIFHTFSMYTISCNGIFTQWYDECTSRLSAHGGSCSCR